MVLLEGLELGGIASGIKKSGSKDLMLAKLSAGSTVAGVFTRSTTQAPSVVRCRKLLAKGIAPISGLVVNSGNANVFTGKSGEDALAQMVQAAATKLNCAQAEVFAASTGVIGEPLAVELITKAMPHIKLAAKGWDVASRAILTTDTHPKTAFRTLSNGISIGAIAKGAGMIAPNMATMLCFIFTDAKLPDPHQAIADAVEQSFNRITVEGDTSTSDSVLLISTNQKPHSAKAEFSDALGEVCLELAHQIIRDAEGATKFIEVEVSEAQDNAVAKTLAFAVANSPLVKIALGAGDANWGRIVMALGKTTLPLERRKISIALNGVVVAKNGEAIEIANGLASGVGNGGGNGAGNKAGKVDLSSPNIKVAIQLGQGKGSCKVWTSDLNQEFVRLNADYRT